VTPPDVIISFLWVDTPKGLTLLKIAFLWLPPLWPGAGQRPNAG